jgi:hypothetical protein
LIDGAFKVNLHIETRRVFAHIQETGKTQGQRKSKSALPRSSGADLSFRTSSNELTDFWPRSHTLRLFFPSIVDQKLSGHPTLEIAAALYFVKGNDEKSVLG